MGNAHFFCTFPIVYNKGMKCVHFSRLPLTIFILFFVLAGQGEAACIHLGRTLKQGMTGDDIQLLQKFLNSDKRTLVANTGLGSRGQESRVFGKATLAAVKKFQALNIQTVLVPASLTAPSGIIGALSRAEIARQSCVKELSASTGTQNTARLGVETSSPILSREEQSTEYLVAIKKRLEEAALRARITINTTPVSTSTIPQAVVPVAAPSQYPNLSSDTRLIEAATKYSGNDKDTTGSSPVIGGIAPTQPMPGLIFQLVGSGFTKNDMVKIDELILTPLQVNPLGTLATVLLPINSASGEHKIEILNAYGRSEKYLLTIKARNTIGPAPIIDSISPSSGNIGANITLTGRNLSVANDILTTTKIIKGIPSKDGQTLSFTLQAEDYLIGGDGRLFPGLPFSIAILNELGLSDPINFTIE